MRSRDAADAALYRAKELGRNRVVYAALGGLRTRRTATKRWDRGNAPRWQPTTPAPVESHRRRGERRRDPAQRPGRSAPQRRYSCHGRLRAPNRPCRRWTRASPPDLIVTDLYMPGIDGLALLSHLLRSSECAAFNQVPHSGDLGNRRRSPEPERIAADLGAEAFLPCPSGRQTVYRTSAGESYCGENMSARVPCACTDR